MKCGSLDELHLESAVLDIIRKENKVSDICAELENDFSIVCDIVTADGSGDNPEIAWIKAYNNFCCSLSRCVGARISILLPQSAKEAFIKRSMETFSALATESGVKIVGGNTQVAANVTLPYFSVSLFGKRAIAESAINANNAINAKNDACTLGASPFYDKKSVRPGDAIVMAGYAGMLGTNELIAKHAEAVKSRFGNHFSSGRLFEGRELMIDKYISALDDKIDGHFAERLQVAERIQTVKHIQAVKYVHDVSFGGVYTALWQLGKWAGKGISVDNKRIPIRQETIEICELQDCNPYIIDGTGAVLFICENCEQVIKHLERGGMICSMIGRITDGKERLIRFGDGELRKLSPVQ